jgi:hypothetical protein
MASIGGAKQYGRLVTQRPYETTLLADASRDLYRSRRLPWLPATEAHSGPWHKELLSARP